MDTITSQCRRADPAGEEEFVSSAEHGGAKATPAGLRPKQLLRIRAIWVTPLAVSGVLVFLMSLFYVGSVVNPLGHLSGLPVGLVDQDQGATVLGRHVDIGAEVAAGLQRSHAVSSRLTLDTGGLAQAEQQMKTGNTYATIVVPAGFTDSLLSAYGLASTSGTNGTSDTSDTSGKPTVRILTNPRAGSIGVSLATGVSQPALRAASLEVGRQLGSEAATLHRSVSPGVSASNPLTVTTTMFNPLPPNSALGLSAFYISLLAIMCGFLGAILVHTTVDAALGYGVTEIGPKWSQRMPVPISRRDTLLSKWVVALVLVPVLTGILLLVSVGLLGMNAPYVWELWLFTSFAGIAIAAGTLALFAALGSLGQLIAMLLFIYLALASSGGTIPLQALPGPFRFVANFEPLRQVLDGVRSILYFGASGAAGLTRGVVLTAIGLIFWLLVGLAVTSWYDGRGKDRMRPEMLAYVQQSAAAYGARGEGGKKLGSDRAAASPESADSGDANAHEGD
jgi:YhgE/Pip-like protein